MRRLLIVLLLFLALFARNVSVVYADDTPAPTVGDPPTTEPAPADPGPPAEPMPSDPPPPAEPPPS